MFGLCFLSPKGKCLAGQSRTRGSLFSRFSLHKHELNVILQCESYERIASIKKRRETSMRRYPNQTLMKQCAAKDGSQSSDTRKRRSRRGTLTLQGGEDYDHNLLGQGFKGTHMSQLQIKGTAADCIKYNDIPNHGDAPGSSHRTVLSSLNLRNQQSICAKQSIIVSNDLRYIRRLLFNIPYVLLATSDTTLHLGCWRRNIQGCV